MKHSEAIEYWDDMARSNPDEKTVKVNPQNDYTGLDADFIMRYANKDSEILDLASGTGLAISKYYKRVGHIDAVELFPQFTKFIPQSSNISIFNESITDFNPKKEYDLILMFGIVQYFNEKEITELYQKYAKHLKSSGKLIVKNQFGVREDVVVSGISEELGRPYHSEYRYLEKEKSILSSIGLKVADIVDIYPPVANRWDNTHFYAIVANKN